MSRLHLMFRFEDASVPDLAALRHRWDPGMAARVPPHVTLTYPQELSNQSALVERGLQAASMVRTFTMQALHAATDDDGAGGVWIEVGDPTGSWSKLRQIVVPDSSLDVGPHLTIVHPRTSDQGPTAWPVLRSQAFDHTLMMHEFVLTSTQSDESSQVLHRFPLLEASKC